MNTKKEMCDIEIQIELNRRMFENKKITKDIFSKVNDILIQRLNKLREMCV